MYSSEDLERFYVEYQSEWVPRGMTMRAFCDRNNVPYRVMDNFVRNIRKKIVEVEMTGRPEEGESEAPAATHPQAYARKFNKQAYAWSRLFNDIISFQSKCLIWPSSRFYIFVNKKINAKYRKNNKKND